MQRILRTNLRRTLQKQGLRLRPPNRQMMIKVEIGGGWKRNI